MACHCQSDQRSLALVSPRLNEAYSDLVELAESLQWPVHHDLGAIRAELGTGLPLASVSDLIGFLRGVLDPLRLSELRAAWIDSRPIASQVPSLLKATSVAELVDGDSSILLDILNQRRIETYFQPIFTTNELEPWGFECLMRARDNAGNLLNPSQLLGYARQENLVFMLDRVCRETHLLNAGKMLAGREFYVLINFLPTTVYNPEFCLKTTVSAAQRGGIPLERIIFEVVETENVEDREHLREILDFWRTKGFKVALDDIGSGYAGLSLLADLNPDLLKLDRDLVEKALTSSLHCDVLSMLVRLAKDHGKKVLAEGIEQVAQLEMVRRIGVDYVQGFLLGRPAPQPVYEPTPMSRNGQVVYEATAP